MTRIHRGLICLRGEPQALDLLALDPHVAKLIVARPVPELLVFLPASTAKLQARLLKLGAVPRREQAR